MQGIAGYMGKTLWVSDIFRRKMKDDRCEMRLGTLENVIDVWQVLRHRVNRSSSKHENGTANVLGPSHIMPGM